MIKVKELGEIILIGILLLVIVIIYTGLVLHVYLNRRKQMTKQTTTDNTTKEFWAGVEFYEPFTLGGKVWQTLKYKVLGTPHLLPKGIKAFSFEMLEKYCIHEVHTGKAIAIEPTLELALKQAKINIKETPDILKQIRNTPQITNFKEIPIRAVIHRLGKSKKVTNPIPGINVHARTTKYAPKEKH